MAKKMMTPQEVAAKVAAPTTRQYPVGKAQAVILSKLNLTATGFAHAEAIFKALGIVVTPGRRGAAPTVTILQREAGGMNEAGEGEVWQQYPDVDLGALD